MLTSLATLVVKGQGLVVTFTLTSLEGQVEVTGVAGVGHCLVITPHWRMTQSTSPLR
ncbi:hypothetical protein DPMN_117920 [Dreissena polymorpha]|uniref:Uncharacterized protein n=1 Tax=Dreissena polymorpha TaxID=45954 RepID=A0A9D4GJ72_DREPO|nr:hypothetical protein DPMN_117920 [Dreissena polymorpha]